MIQNIYTVYDSAAKAYLPPFFVHNRDLAIRGFKNAVNTESHAFSKNPEDYTLFHIGSFDDASGTLDATAPMKVANGVEMLSGQVPMAM